MSGPEIAPTGYWRASDVRRHHMWSRALAHWIADHLRGDELVPVYDFGCGMGFYMAVLRARGFHRVFGLEGDPPKDAEDGAILKHDLTLPYKAPITGNAVCLEVGEHVPAEYEAVLLDSLVGAVRPGGKLVLSWAVRGQGGDGHVNCLDNHEVVERVVRRGLEHHPAASEAARARAELPWFKNTLTVYSRPL